MNDLKKIFYKGLGGVDYKTLGDMELGDAKYIDDGRYRYPLKGKDGSDYTNDEDMKKADDKFKAEEFEEIERPKLE